MSIIIPLNSLVLTVGQDNAVNTENAKKLFPDYEVISVEDVRYSLVGDRNHRGIDGQVFGEIGRRITTKLSLGERVVVASTNLSQPQRKSLASRGTKAGVPIFYLPDQANRGNIPDDVWVGDRIAEVINTSPSVVKKQTDLMGYIRENYSGITVVGDIHGMYQSLLSVVEWASRRNHFILFLGDIIDYGPNNIETADEVYRLVMRGRAEVIKGNHERKIFKWIREERSRPAMNISEGNKVTINQINALSPDARQQWTSRFTALVSRCPLHLEMGDYRFAHAAIHPKLWTGEMIKQRNLEKLSMFGEWEGVPPEGQKPVMTYDWCKSVPAGKTAVVGHDSTKSKVSPVTVVNDAGGQTVFLDTGSGKGGTLSFADFRFDDNGGLQIQNYRAL